MHEYIKEHVHMKEVQTQNLSMYLKILDFILDFISLDVVFLSY